jgi:hypothetical protein
MADLGDRDEIVVFVIGMRINRFWQFWRWLPVFAAMPKMIVELCRDPSLGLLARPSTFMSGRVFLLVQYWRSFEDLERFARAPQGSHLEAWRNFNRRIRDNGSVGIFHETYRVPSTATCRSSGWRRPPGTRPCGPAATARPRAWACGPMATRRSSPTDTGTRPDAAPGRGRIHGMARR